MSLIIRLRSKNGTFRLPVTAAMTGDDFAEAIINLATVDADPESVTISNQPTGGEKINLSTLEGRKVGDMMFKNGELLFVEYDPADPDEDNSVPATTPFDPPIIVSAVAAGKQREPVEESAVDKYWKSRDGKIPRKRDEKMCKHGLKGMCDYCMPLEPYDPGYHTENKIKHLSLPTYIKKIAGSISASSTTTHLPPLSPVDYRVKVPCPSGTSTHKPWPKGICSKCQPSAITLQSQPFRMVDHVEFSSPSLINDFLDNWRKSGVQKFGFLMGSYEPYDGVPMGVKAVVQSVVLVREQEGESDGLTVHLDPWFDEARIRSLGKDVGLEIVGCLWSDLTTSPEDRTKVLYKRHPQSFYLSSLEAIFAATLQLKYPYMTNDSPTQQFSSRLVTCVLTGTEEGGIDILAFQVSEQAEGMVQAGMIEASVDAGTVRMKQEGEGTYIPDVFYSFHNEYNLLTKLPAKPCFPVEYLLVSLTHGFPASEKKVFESSKFPALEHDQGIGKFVNMLADVVGVDHEGWQMSEEKRAAVESVFSDWNLLEFLSREGSFTEDEFKLICKIAVSHHSEPSLLKTLLSTPGWKNLAQILDVTLDQRAARAAQAIANANNPPEIEGYNPMDFEDHVSGAGGGGGGGGPVTCPQCTFENPPGSTGDCEICGLPLQG